jgi:hypothetical protein
MKEPAGDKIFYVIIIILVFTFAAGWIILLTITLLQSLLPKQSHMLEKVLQSVSKPLGSIQKYAVYIALGLCVIRLLAAWLGWAPPLNTTSDSPD